MSFLRKKQKKTFKLKEDNKSNEVEMKHWCMIGKNMKIDDKMDNILILNDLYWNTAYHESIIEPVKPNQNKSYIWTIKIINKKPNWTLSVGIDNAKCNFINTQFGGQKKTNNYSIYFTDNKSVKMMRDNIKKDFSLSCKGGGDIITTFLEFDKHNTPYLSFQVNDSKKEYAFSNLIKTMDKYRFAVTLFGKGASIQFINYNISSNNGIFNEYIDEDMNNKNDEKENLDLINPMTKYRQMMKNSATYNNNKQKNDRIDGLVNNLKKEFNSFKDEYNKIKIEQIARKSPQILIDNKSKLKMNNKQDKIIGLMQIANEFSQYISNMQLLIDKFTKPDINNHINWNANDIILWISTLDNGKYAKYAKGFRKSGISSTKWLPQLTQQQLSSPPFNIALFQDQLALLTYFQSLNDVSNNVQNNVENNDAPPPYSESQLEAQLEGGEGRVGAGFTLQ